MSLYRYVNTPAGEFKSGTVVGMSLHYLRDQTLFLYREELVTYRDPVLLQLYQHRDEYCSLTSSFVYYFNNIFTFSPERYSESYIPLITTCRCPITLTTPTYCYTQPIPSTLQDNQQSSNTAYI
ncbi:hypothetical protein LOAG_07454 [Loa loa]|uniref:Uncharacterized protein n=1 Tax=Loa loa TaxID=7209 RepID=A0A1I7W1K1_LOALO|nr:hypothetical protein LOAG_07454 [Loa loa]EFO21036.1 hypothetical protein LOAG_07454 [Loa loa]